MSGAATAPTDYVIRTRFDVGAVPGLGAVNTQIGMLDKRISGLGGTLTNKLVAGFAAVASAQGLKSLASQIVGINVELQNAEFGIGTLLSALGKTDFDTAFGAAREQVKGLREDAAKGIGELSDYMRGFQVLLGPVSQGGASLKQIRELNRLAIAAGGAMQGQTGMRLAPLDIVQALRGGIDEKITPFAMLAVQSIGVGKGEFKAMDTGKRVETLIRGFKSFESAANAFGRTWDAQISTFRDNLKDVARTATEPLFHSWTMALTEANKWLQENKSLVDDIASRAGDMAIRGQGALLANAGNIGVTGAAGLAGALGVRGAMAFGGALGMGGGAGVATAGLAGAALAPITFALASAAKRWPEMARDIASDLGALGQSIGGFGAAVLKFADNPLVQSFGARIGFVFDKMIEGMTRLVNFATWTLDQINGLTTDPKKKLEEIGRLAYDAIAHTQPIGPNPVLAANPNLPWSGLQGNPLFAFTGMQGQGLGKSGKPEFTMPPVVKIDKIEIKVEAERLDDPNTVARTFEAAMSKIMNHPRTARGGRLVPKPL